MITGATYRVIGDDFLAISNVMKLRAVAESILKLGRDEDGVIVRVTVIMYLDLISCSQLHENIGNK